MQIEVSVEIDAPAERVWDVMADVERWPEWTASMRRVERLDRGPFAVGSEARVKQPKMPVLRWTVVSVEPGRAFAWETRSPGACTVGTHVVDPQGPGRSRATLSVKQSGPVMALLAPFIRPMTRRYVEIEAAGLKRRCEAAWAPDR